MAHNEACLDFSWHHAYCTVCSSVYSNQLIILIQSHQCVGGGNHFFFILPYMGMCICKCINISEMQLLTK